MSTEIQEPIPPHILEFLAYEEDFLRRQDACRKDLDRCSARRAREAKKAAQEEQERLARDREEAETDIEAGIVYWSRIRDFLEECRFRGMKIRWFESSGWVSRRWVIHGEAASIREIAASFTDFARQANERAEARRKG